MRKFILLGAIAAVLGGTTLAEARDDRSCTSMPANQWLSTPELAAKFAAQGYAVRKIELKRNCGEAKLLDQNGLRTEVRFDPTNAAIVSRHGHMRRHHHDHDRYHHGYDRYRHDHYARH